MKKYEHQEPQGLNYFVGGSRKPTTPEEFELERKCNPQPNYWVDDKVISDCTYTSVTCVPPKSDNFKFGIVQGPVCPILVGGTAHYNLGFPCGMSFKDLLH